MAVDWTKLPPELLETISQKLKIYRDYLHFRAVCRVWRSSTPKTPHHLPPQFPWLTLRADGFFDLSAKKFHSLHLPQLCHPTKRRCGSSQGWLMILDETPEILLLNPFTRVERLLPPLSDFPNVISFSFFDVGREYTLRSPSGERFTRNLRQMRDSFIKKFVLSSSPPNQGTDFTVLVILYPSGDLAFCRDGDRCWRFIDGASSFCEDVVYNNGLFYAVDKYGAIAVCDVRGDSPRVRLIELMQGYVGSDMQYLVCSDGEILLVERYLALDVDEDKVIYSTRCFEVFRLDWCSPQWERLRDLGDKILFLGQNSSLSLSALDYPGCEGNRIYFTDDCSENEFDTFLGGYDVAIFRLCDGISERLPHSMPPPIWVTPNPC